MFHLKQPLQSFLFKKCIDKLFLNSRYISTSSSRIPIIDVGNFIDGDTDTKLKIAQQIYEVGRKIGFMYIKNSNITKDIRTKTIEQTKWLFSLPMSKKQMFAQSDENIRGYYRFEGVGYGEQLIIDQGSNIIKDDSGINNDYIEAFLIGNDKSTPWSLKKSYYEYRYGKMESKRYQRLSHCQPNQWPSTTNSEDDSLTYDDIESAKAFREHMRFYFDECSNTLNQIIVPAIALSLGHPEDHFQYLHTKNDHTMELKHYTPNAATIKNNDNNENTMVRMNEHADLSTVTLLIQNENTDGLQLFMEDTQEWIDAPYLDDSILVNTGDIMERLTNKEYKSTKHRVVMNKYRHLNRYSIVFFAVPNWELEIGQNSGDLMGDLIPFN